MKMIFLLTMLLMASCGQAQTTDTSNPEKTIFQTSSAWRPTIDVRADVVLVYGTNDSKDMTFEERVQSWRDRGYTTHYMTGIAWGDYVDYFTGGWDGKIHLDEGQVEASGDTIWHGHLIPYIVPSRGFLHYLKEKHVKRAIDAGIDAIYLEEPEFWARAGYSESFKKEWRAFYGFDWQPQHSSPGNTYLSNKLKYQLYYNAINEVCTYAKEYGASQGMDVRCYIPTHSLLNYSQWQIVSPEASLASLPCVDGYVAQVWTGTSRTPNMYDGALKERVFETAFLEYGSMESMTEPTGRKMFFLTDPIEDWPRDWVDYKKNYQATFIAQLLYPNIANYEVMPWPKRIYEGLYRSSDDSEHMETIPRFYSTQMQVMINALNKMPASGNRVSGSRGISVLMANSLMFQSFPNHRGYEDPHFSNFYGQALPFVKRGIPVNTVHIENLIYPKALHETKVLVMSYANMKPLSPEPHYRIAEWVKKGGVLVYCGEDKDPFQTVPEWWNNGDVQYSVPSDHLFQQMGMEQNPREGEYPYGEGTVYVIREDPKQYVMKEGGDQKLVEVVKTLYDNKAGKERLAFNNFFTLERGSYRMTSVMEESVSDEPYEVNGLFIDLFDPGLPVIQKKTVLPGEQSFLYDIRSLSSKNSPQVLAAACRTYQEEVGKNHFSFVAKSPKNSDNVMRILLPKEYRECRIVDAEGNIMHDAKHAWDEVSKTAVLHFRNEPDGVNVLLRW
jgi:hypothetical protein